MVAGEGGGGVFRFETEHLPEIVSAFESTRDVFNLVLEAGQILKDFGAGSEPKVVGISLQLDILSVQPADLSLHRVEFSRHDSSCVARLLSTELFRSVLGHTHKVRLNSFR